MLQRTIASIPCLQSYRESPSEWFRLVFNQTFTCQKFRPDYYSCLHHLW
jgi:hypothetical protein